MIVPRAILCLALLVAAVPLRAAEPQIRVVTDGDGQPSAVEVLGLSKDELARLANLESHDAAWSRLLAVYVVDAQGAIQLPALSGRHAIAGDVVRFTPQFALRPGMSYEAAYFPPLRRSADSPPRYTQKINVPAPPPAKPTKVTAIYPSASTLPDNQLRFYLHFSAPMDRGKAYDHVQLLKADGTPVKRSFLEIGEELWDPSGQRLTLLFDPGRVKKGLSPRQQFGPVLEAGQSYRLVIDKAWRDANGQPLAAGFEKRFSAGPPVESAVDFKHWQITPPIAGTRDPLVVHFSRPLDRALLMRMIDVAAANGKPLAGEIMLGDDERRWEFRPEQPWGAGGFNLVVDATLEDTAGNNLARPFEVDVFDQVDKDSAPELIRIPFTISKPE